jgi:hypothetical protein
LEKKLTARPTAPSPKMATDEPFFGFATFKVAPRPTGKKKTNLYYMKATNSSSIEERLNWISPLTC